MPLEGHGGAGKAGKKERKQEETTSYPLLLPLREKLKESELLASPPSSHCKIRGNEEEKLPVRLEEKKP